MDIERLTQRQNDPTVGEQVAARRTERSTGDPQPTVEPNKNRFSADRLEISSEARDLARARQAVEDAPDVRADRVAEIRKRIEDGTYSVAPELLARKLLGETDES